MWKSCGHIISHNKSNLLFLSFKFFPLSSQFSLKFRGNYTLHPKLSKCTLYTINYHAYHTLYPGVIFAFMFDWILFHVTNTCFLLRWNKLKRLKHPSSKSIKTILKNQLKQKPIFFHISLSSVCASPQNLKSHPPKLSMSTHFYRKVGITTVASYCRSEMKIFSLWGV